MHLLQASGAIVDLRAHPQRKYDLVVNGVLICRYVADFEYRDSDGQMVVEDLKGFRTRVFVLKQRLMRACLGIEVREIRGRARRRGGKRCRR